MPQRKLESKMLVTQSQLDAFVAKADALGGPGNPDTEAYWRDFQYEPTVRLDPPGLDPDSDAYQDTMMRLYEELANRRFEPRVTEFTDVDVERLIPLESPYAHDSARNRVLHYLRLSTVYHLGAVNGGRALDMGCGWGLSSEFLAQLGHAVTAVDINPRFVDLVNGRAQRLGLNIKAWQSGFEDFAGEPGSYDVALFYECLHHAANLPVVLDLVAALLKPGGALLLAGEPIQHNWWTHWGLRLDALSVYCIRKFGWFESGWSADYLCRAIADAGMVPVLYTHPDPAVGISVVARKTQSLDISVLRGLAEPADWWPEGGYLVSNRSGNHSRLRLYGSPPKRITMKLNYFGTGTLDISIDAHGVVRRHKLVPGVNVMSMAPGQARQFQWELKFSCEGWCPQDALRNGDMRRLGFHLEHLDLN
jgi:2-polyprenyl-3-methyl-5-hydroxy-6-metoxy-1,4-benzoquinol methylase